MPMAGQAEEYEKMALASMRRASDQGGDPKFHHMRAQIFAILALSAATDAASTATAPDKATADA